MCEPVITGGPGSRPGASADDVADLVDAYLETEVAHPRDHEIATLLVRVRQREPVAPAAFDRTDLGQGGDATKKPRAVDSQIEVGRLHQERGSVNALTSTRAAPTAATAASNRSLPRSAVAPVGSPMCPLGPKSFDSHPKLT